MKNVILGVSGQDGYFLSSLLHDLGQTVIGLVPEGRPTSLSPLTESKLSEKFTVDFCSNEDLGKVLKVISPHRIFNLVGFSSVQKSFIQAQECISTNFLFFERLLSVVKESFPDRIPHVFQCSSSEMYALNGDSVIDENSEIRPLSPYGISKSASHHLAHCYREAYGIPVSTGILFNHESELRSATYFSGKAIKGIVDVYLGVVKEFSVQSLDFQRDWCYAGDVANAMHQISSLDEPSDFVVASGKLRSGRDLIREGFKYLGLEEKWERFVLKSSRDIRPLDHRGKIGNFQKLNDRTGWSPDTEFSAMIAKMIDSELQNRNMK